MNQNYQESRCMDKIDKLYECCSKLYDKDPEARSMSCPKPEALQRKLREMGNSKKGQK